MARTRPPEKDSFHLGMLILKYLITSRRSRGVSQIANDLDLPISTTHDELKLLGKLGFVCRHGKTNRYEPTPEIFRFMSEVVGHFGITPLVHDAIERAAERLGISVYLCRYWRNETYVVCACGVLGGTRVIGAHTVPYAAAAAKALISCRDEAEWERHAPGPDSPKLTEFTVTDPDAYFDMLRKARADGVAWSEREVSEVICSVATSLRIPGEDVPDYAVAFVTSYQQWQVLNRFDLSEDLAALAKELAALIEEVPRFEK